MEYFAFTKQGQAAQGDLQWLGQMLNGFFCVEEAREDRSIIERDARIEGFGTY